MSLKNKVYKQVNYPLSLVVFMKAKKLLASLAAALTIGSGILTSSVISKAAALKI